MSLISLVAPSLHNLVTRLTRYQVRDENIAPLTRGRAFQSVLLNSLLLGGLLHCSATVSLSREWQRLVKVNTATKVSGFDVTA